MCSPNGLGGCFRHSEVLHLPLLDEVFYRSGYIFDRNFRVNAVLIEKINGIDAQPFQRAFDTSLDVIWLAANARISWVTVNFVELESEFGRNDHVSTKRCQGLLGL